MLSARLNLAQRGEFGLQLTNHGQKDQTKDDQAMQLDQKGNFPFISVLVTGGHTEFALTRGVGLHTVMGFTIDTAIGTYLDRVSNILIK